MIAEAILDFNMTIENVLHFVEIAEDVQILTVTAEDVHDYVVTVDNVQHFAVTGEWGGDVLTVCFLFKWSYMSVYTSNTVRPWVKKTLVN